MKNIQWMVQFIIKMDQPKPLPVVNQKRVSAIGGAEGTGRLVGSSIGTAAAPSLSSIPFVGWVG